MSVIQAQLDRQPSPALAPNNPFASNNPFRNKVSPTSPDFPSPPARYTRNPFLDVFDDDSKGDPVANEAPANGNYFKASSFDSDKRPTLSRETTDLLGDLNLDDTPKKMTRVQTLPNGPPRGPPSNENRMRTGPPPYSRGGGNTAQRPRGPPPPSQHHHSRSSEVASTGETSNAGLRVPGRPPPGRIPPVTDRNLRPRSNSESSVSARDASDPDKLRERRRAERRERDPQIRSREREKGSVSKEDTKKSAEPARRKKATPLDVIDKLDLTGIYGGGLFHHDGPFDACNPHRNKNKGRAPMMAFPEGSQNNALGGFDTTARPVDHSKYFGNRDPEAYNDYSMPAANPARRGSEALDIYGMPTGLAPERPSSKRAHSFDPLSRPPVHGEESLGLGTSTFLDGAPAPKRAIEAAVMDDENRPKTSGGLGGGGGLQRKKSLVQKIRSISNNRPNGPYPIDESIPVPDRRNKPRTGSSPTEATPLRRPFTPTSPPPVNRAVKPSEDYDAAWDQKEQSINTAEQERRTRDRAPSSPKKTQPGMIRYASDAKVPTGGSSNNNNNVNAEGQGSAGLMKRVKSLSKGKRRET